MEHARTLPVPYGNDRNPQCVARLPRTSMKVFQVLRSPRKMKLMCSKCCTCHAEEGGAQVTQGVARPEVLMMMMMMKMMMMMMRMMMRMMKG